ncbi:MAG TPA: lysine--tRNA ligase [Candidatus Magasanikbacteria bacterium]|nr:lysine--tRNA ligase [Candidatus Magasanikbacteria bacterium]
MSNIIEDNLNVNDEREVRLKKLTDLQAMGINPYPARVGRECMIETALKSAVGEKLRVAGRIFIKREMGKLTFAHMADSTGRIQLAFKQDDLGADNYKLFCKKIDAGDILEVVGERFETHKGEASILVKEWRLLSKSLLPLPDKFHGLQDDEIRYRKRHLDFLVNEEARQKMMIRSKLIAHLRHFLENQGFLEVETPYLEVVASGAMAETFDTHFNTYDLDVHLRICAGELWQKRLLVGGFEKTFELGRVFRNEGVDRQHNPEFTMLEYYWAYADFEDNMRMHEEMIPAIVRTTLGTTTITIDDQEIDFSGPFPRHNFHDLVLEHSGIEINDYEDFASLAKVAQSKKIDCGGITERGKLIDAIFKQTVRPKIIQPTFVLNYPVELKPLAKKADDPRYTEMFQLIVNGFELSNSYTELNDPIDQKERFVVQSQNKVEGDKEAMNYDADYIDALEQGMPPATGTGIGIDRFVALLTGSHTLREVIAFPIMKPIIESELSSSEE